MSIKEIELYLGDRYSIVERKKEDNNDVVVIAYPETYYPDEHYLFKFRNGRLEEWHREVYSKSVDKK